LQIAQIGKSRTTCVLCFMLLLTLQFGTTIINTQNPSYSMFSSSPLLFVCMTETETSWYVYVNCVIL